MERNGFFIIFKYNFFKLKIFVLAFISIFYCYNVLFAIFHKAPSIFSLIKITIQMFPAIVKWIAFNVGDNLSFRTIDHHTNI